MLLLDTNVISELRKVRDGRTNPLFIAWAKTLDWSDLYLSVITLYELELGVGRLEEYDTVQGKILRTWLGESVLKRFESHILPVNEAVATRSAQLQIPRTRQVEDTLIAATAYVYNLRVVTRNVSDFEGTGVRIINPWEI
jgi:predicted nucleic acid-binding protein